MLVKLLYLALLVGLVACGCAHRPGATARHFENWPAGTDPAEVSRRVAENFAARSFRFQTQPSRAHLGLIYPEACAWYGALTAAELTGDRALRDRLIAKFEPFLTPEGNRHVNRSAHVDYRVIGIVPLEIYRQTGDTRFRDLGLQLADAQWENTTPDGITMEARYWIDDMYMIPALQVQAYRVTRDLKYLDRAALTMAAYLDRLQEPGGLFHHGENAPFYWSRGNGWMAAGAAELLRDLPRNHPQYARIMTGYRKMMAALLPLQDSDGLWHQLLDGPDSWPETSGTAMFAFAMVTGVKEGWLEPDRYGPAARRAWLALVARLDEKANLRDVCAGTNKADKEVGPNLAAQRQFYLDRPRLVGDLHGQAPLLWTATALLR